MKALKYVYMAALGVALAAPALAAPEGAVIELERPSDQKESVLLAGKITDKNGSQVMSVSVFALDGVPSHIERTETYTYLDKRSITKDGETTVLAPAQFKTGITLDLTPFKASNGVQLLTMEGKNVKFLGFQKYEEMPGVQKPLYSTTEFKSTVRVVDGKVELPFGACAYADEKLIGCEYTLSLDVKTL
jgi:hypothetical protein